MCKKRVMSALIAGCFALVCSGTAYAAQHTDTDANGNLYAYTMTDTQTGESKSPEDYTFTFPEQTEADGKDYTLNHVEYSVCSLYEEQYGDLEIAEQITETEDGISTEDKETYAPSKKEIEQDGFRYQYKDTEFQESEDSQEPISIETYMDTDYTTGDMSDVERPETLPFSYEGNQYTLQYDHTEKIVDGWKTGYTIDGTIRHYEASTIQVGDVVIEPDKIAAMPLSDLQNFIAKYGYSPDVYRLQSVGYSSEPYTDAEGVLCRDYKIVTDIYMRQFRHYYTYNEDRSIYVAENTYALSDSDAAKLEELKNTYKVSATAFYDEVEQEEVQEKKLSLPAKVAIAFGVIVGVVLIAALILYLIKGGRKGTDYRSKRDSKRDFKNM